MIPVTKLTEDNILDLDCLSCGKNNGTIVSEPNRITHSFTCMHCGQAQILYVGVGPWAKALLQEQINEVKIMLAQLGVKANIVIHVQSVDTKEIICAKNKWITPQNN